MSQFDAPTPVGYGLLIPASDTREIPMTIATAPRHDAATVCARSEASVTTESFHYGLQANLFTAQVTLDGIDFDYLFQGDWFVGGTSVALGRARRMGLNSFRATTASGTVVADDVSRREAHIALYLAARG